MTDLGFVPAEILIGAYIGARSLAAPPWLRRVLGIAFLITTSWWMVLGLHIPAPTIAGEALKTVVHTEVILMTLFLWGPGGRGSEEI